MGVGGGGGGEGEGMGGGIIRRVQDVQVLLFCPVFGSLCHPPPPLLCYRPALMQGANKQATDMAGRDAMQVALGRPEAPPSPSPLPPLPLSHPISTPFLGSPSIFHGLSGPREMTTWTVGRLYPRKCTARLGRHRARIPMPINPDALPCPACCAVFRRFDVAELLTNHKGTSTQSAPGASGIGVGGAEDGRREGGGERDDEEDLLSDAEL